MMNITVPSVSVCMVHVEMIVLLVDVLTTVLITANVFRFLLEMELNKSHSVDVMLAGKDKTVLLQDVLSVSMASVMDLNVSVNLDSGRMIAQSVSV